MHVILNVLDSDLCGNLFADLTQKRACYFECARLCDNLFVDLVQKSACCFDCARLHDNTLISMVVGEATSRDTPPQTSLLVSHSFKHNCGTPDNCRCPSSGRLSHYTSLTWVGRCWEYERQTDRLTNIACNVGDIWLVTEADRLRKYCMSCRRLQPLLACCGSLSVVRQCFLNTAVLI